MNHLKNMLGSLHFWRVWLPPHVLAVAGIVLFPSWNILWTALIGYTLISGLGVAVGLHRYFSHKAFVANKFWQQAMLLCGMIACHGHPLFWVALHRGLHHRFADTDRDPHSPIAHSWWTAYQGYAFDPKLVEQVPLRAGADFLRHPDWQWSVTHYHKVLYAVWLVFATLSWYFNAPWLLVGLTCAQVYGIHQEALVNLVGHIGGFGAYRNYLETGEHSVNRNLLGLFTWGQALHNNHHGDAGNPSFANSAKFPQRFEFDPSMLWIWAIQSKA